MSNKLGAISITVISDPRELSEIEATWDAFVNKHTNNPFLLNGFVKQHMKNCSDGWIPRILTIMVNNQLVGLAPLKMKKKLGTRHFTQLLPVDLSPDLVIDGQRREACIRHIIYYLFKTLQCSFIDLTLPAESPNLKILEQLCKAEKIYLAKKPGPSHSIIIGGYSWNELKKLRGKNQNMRKKFSRITQIERKLNNTGSWKVTCNENLDEESDTFRKILHVERMSWKEEWRAQKNISIERNLIVDLKAADNSVRNNPYFKPNVWFLELNGQPLAYALVLQYKESAFMTKTSYDKRFKQFYPGIYLQHIAIRKLLDEEKVRMIDFLTDLPFHKIWTDTCFNRVKLLLSRGVLSKVYSMATGRLRLGKRAAPLWYRVRGKMPAKIRKIVE